MNNVEMTKYAGMANARIDATARRKILVVWDLIVCLCEGMSVPA